MAEENPKGKTSSFVDIHCTNSIQVLNLYGVSVMPLEINENIGVRTDNSI